MIITLLILFIGFTQYFSGKKKEIMTFLFIVITLLALIFGAILGFASIKLKVEADPVVEKIDAILPQSQCGQCGYPGCKPYAEAICNGDEITKCIPGGQTTIVKLPKF